MTSSFDADAVESVEQQPVREDLDHPPTAEEIEEAVSALKSNKAGGRNELTPELVKLVCTVFDNYVLDLFQSV